MIADILIPSGSIRTHTHTMSEQGYLISSMLSSTQATSGRRSRKQWQPYGRSVAPPWRDPRTGTVLTIGARQNWPTNEEEVLIQELRRELREAAEEGTSDDGGEGETDDQSGSE